MAVIGQYLYPTPQAGHAEMMAQRLITWANLRPPVDVEEAATRLGIDLESLTLSPGVGGLLVKEAPRRWLIITNSRLTDPDERRWTIAHELGHWTLHRPLLQRDSAELSGRQHEHEANRFARELLLPTDELEEDVRHGNFDRIVYRYGAPRYVVATVLRRYGYDLWRR